MNRRSPLHVLMGLWIGWKILGLLVGLAAARFLVVVISAATPTSLHTLVAPSGSSSSPTSTTSAMPTTPAATDAQLLSAIRKFALAYGGYLDGRSATTLNGTGSITAASQATQAGRIPPTFRDGRVTIAQLGSLEATCCSASVTVVLANREESYPFDEQLLLEQRGWVVDQITPPDLSMDRNLRPAPQVATPATGREAAKAFAVAYVNYRSGEDSIRPLMNAAAAKQIAAGTDSLAGESLPKADARLTSIQFGPPSGEEFAATVTVSAGSSRLTFSFLMVRTAAGWECGQYL
jgi:hypothetical protein